MITRAEFLERSPALHKVLFVLVVDAVTSITLIAWEHAHKIRIHSRG